MLKTIRCTNFRGFRSFETDVQAITAFLGPNSSGKTTALHAVRFACDALRLAIDADRPAKLTQVAGQSWILVTDGTLVDFAKLVPLANWQALFVDQAVGEGVSLQVELVFEDADHLQALFVQLACARNEQLKLTVRAKAAQALEAVAGLSRKSSQVNQRLTGYLRDHAPVAVFVPPFYGTVREEEYRARAIIDRLLGSGDQSHVVRNLVVGLEPEQFDRLNAFLMDTIGAKLTARTSPDEVQTVTHLSVQFRDNNGDIELSAAGAGLVNLVALYTALSRWRSESAQRRVLFLLDEPEAHLHPRLQADMTERLGRLVTREFAAQLLLATHSVDILNRLSTSGALLIRCDRGSDPSAIALAGNSELFDDLAEWVDLAPFTAINFLASRRVLFCEGDDEIALLPRLAELKFRNDPARADRFRRWAIIRLQGASNAPVAKLLTKLVRNDVVRARAAQAGGFRVEVVLDRDHHRTPGTRDEVVDNVRETTTVWARHSLESLMMDPTVLASWIRAVALDCTPDDIIDKIEAAITAANADEGLNNAAIEQGAAKLAQGDLFDDNGRRLGGEQKLVHAQRRAREAVLADPAVWQRGKDRAKFILGKVRDDIALPRRNQFPTDVVLMVRRADLNRIGDPAAAIPAEAAALLDRLVSP